MTNYYNKYYQETPLTKIVLARLLATIMMDLSSYQARQSLLLSPPPPLLLYCATSSYILPPLPPPEYIGKMHQQGVVHRKSHPAFAECLQELLVKALTKEGLVQEAQIPRGMGAQIREFKPRVIELFRT